MDIENLEKVEIRGYDTPALACNDKLARIRAKQVGLLRSLESLARNMHGDRSLDF
jgi:glucosamine 6-phosphate synthetase-like amidotransferase/phosphosugar isomerase protein